MFAVEQPFQQKDKIISRNPRLKSSLYCFIEDFFNEDLDLNNLPIEFIEILKKVIVLKKKSSDREAFLFKLDNLVDLKILKFAGEPYTCVDAHLTVDKWYATDNIQKSSKGFSMSHYTTKYIDFSKDKTLIIHVYFNSLGKYINHQINLCVDNEKMPIIADNYLDAMIKKDCQLAMILLQKWLKVKAMHYFELYQSSKDLEEKLSNLFEKRYYNQKFLAQYSKIASGFIQQVEALNKYCDFYKDKRDQIIKDIVTFLYAEAKQFTSIGSHKPFEIVSQDLQAKKPSLGCLKYQKIMVSKDQLLKVEIENLVMHLIEKYQKFIIQSESSNQFDDILLAIDKYIFEQEIRFLLLRIEWLEHNIITSKHPEVVKIEAYLKTFPNLIDLFKEKCLALDLEAVKILFPHVGNLVDPIFYCHDLFLFAINTDDAQEDIMIKIYEYLFDNSEPYRNFIMSDYVELMFVGDGKNEYYGMLAKLFINGKLKLLEMFIGLGLTLDGYGFIREPGEIICTVEYFIRSSDTKDKMLFTIKLLSENHLELLQNATEEKFFFAHKTPIEIFENGSKLKDKANKTRDAYMEKMLFQGQSSSLLKVENNINSYLELIFSVAVKKNFSDEVVLKNLEILAKNYSFEEILLLLSCLTNYSDFKKILFYPDYFDCKVEFAELDQAAGKQDMRPVILMLIEVIYGKLNHSLLDLSKLEIALYKQAASFASLENITDLQKIKAINNYKGYIFLLIFKKTDDKKDILNCETKILNALNQMSKLFNDDLESYLSIIINIVTNSVCNNDLIKNKVYQNAVIKLQPEKVLEAQNREEPILFMQQLVQDQGISQSWFDHENIASNNSIRPVIMI